LSSWRSTTNKQYQFAWRKFVFWCRQRKINPFQSSEKDVIEYINFLKNQNLSYSVINTSRSMLTQTLPFFGINLSGWILKRMLKGCFNFKPPKVRYSCTWDVKTVLKCLCALYPLEDLSLKCLTFKLIALIALTTLFVADRHDDKITLADSVEIPLSSNAFLRQHKRLNSVSFSKGVPPLNVA
jgi:hypothetical protein